jgi:hypothetical protein
MSDDCRLTKLLLNHFINSNIWDARVAVQVNQRVVKAMAVAAQVVATG